MGRGHGNVSVSEVLEVLAVILKHSLPPLTVLV